MKEKQLLWNILNSDEPSKELSNLDNIGALDAFLPELTNLKGIDIIDGQGHKDNFIHTLQVLRQTSEVSTNPWLRLVAILHDAGKAPTKRFDKEKGWTFQNHELISSRMVINVFKKFDLDKSKIEYVSKLVEFHGIAKELTKKGVTDSAIRRFSTELGEWVDDMLLFCKCDMTTKSATNRQRFQLELDNLKNRIINIQKNDEAAKWRAPIDGNFIMKELGISPGRKLGQIKSEIERAIKSKEIEDNFMSAYNYLLKIKNNY
jgi:tRNA nucleotidyltransferase/poly(A) polymerase